MLRLALLAIFALSPTAALAAEQVVFEVTLDMNGNGESERAMLVIVGDKLNIKEGEPAEFYVLEDGQRADLLLYLDYGDDPLYLSDMPTFRKENIALRHGLNFVFVPETKGKGSLNIITSNGYGNTFNTTETLTIVYRNGAFRVGGWATDSHNSREDASTHCSVNYLANKAVKRENDGKDKRIKGKFVPRLLSDWKVDEPPVVCEE